MESEPRENQPLTISKFAESIRNTEKRKYEATVAEKDAEILQLKRDNEQQAKRLRSFGAEMKACLDGQERPADEHQKLAYEQQPVPESTTINNSVQTMLPLHDPTPKILPVVERESRLERENGQFRFPAVVKKEPKIEMSLETVPNLHLWNSNRSGALRFIQSNDVMSGMTFPLAKCSLNGLPTSVLNLLAVQIRELDRKETEKQAKKQADPKSKNKNKTIYYYKRPTRRHNNRCIMCSYSSTSGCLKVLKKTFACTNCVTKGRICIQIIQTPGVKYGIPTMLPLPPKIRKGTWREQRYWIVEKE